MNSLTHELSEWLSDASNDKQSNRIFSKITSRLVLSRVIFYLHYIFSFGSKIFTGESYRRGYHLSS